MASNKNQHFVPRCYLRPFAIIGAESAINIYNIDRQKFISGAPLKHQCSGDYFYGKDRQLERAIQAVENAYASALREILRPRYVLSDEHRNVLRRFCLLQHLRTEAASRRAVEMNELTVTTAGVTDGEYRLEIKEAVQMAMLTFAESIHIVDDLKVCLIRNRTPMPFITSDDPAVLTNRWYLTSKRTMGRSFGLGSAGALLLLPMSPRILCLGYDGDVYSVRNQHGGTEIRREQDVEAFNEHQLLNCRANVFFQDAADSQLVHDAYLGVRAARPVVRHRVHYAVFEGQEGDSKRYRVVKPDEAGDHREAIIHTEVVHARPRSWPWVITWRHKGVVYTNGTGVGYVRFTSTNRLDVPPFTREFA